MEPRREIKIVFTGPMGAGKTTAIAAISDTAPLSTDVRNEDRASFDKDTTTAALDFGQIVLDDGQVVRLYGTPGQQRFAFMWEILGEGALGVVLLLDAAKGALPVLLAMRLQPTEYRVHAGVALAAFLGHVFPVWLKFKGGKGVATAAGVLGVLVPLAAVAGFGVFAILVAIFRVASIGSLAGGITAVVVSFFLGKPIEYPLLGALLLALMVFTHRGNISRLLSRRENKV